MSVLYLCGCGQATSVGASGTAPNNRLGQAEQYCVHDLLVRDGVCHRLADLEIVERRVFHVHADVLDAVRVWRRNDRELAVLLELDEILVWQIVGNVGVAAFEQRTPVAGRRHHAPDDLLRLRQRTAHPRVVALKHDFGAGDPARHLVSAAAGGVLLGELHSPRILFGGMLLHELGIDDARHDHREIGNGKPVLAREINAEGVVVD